MADLTQDQLSALSNIDLELAEIIKHMSYPEPNYDDPPAAIAQMRAMISHFNDPVPIEGVSEETLTFSAHDDFSLKLLVFKPTYATAPPPLMVYYHGGGCTIGSPENCAPLARTLAKKLGVCIVCPQYRLAPEYKFPTNVNDAWDALKWIASHSDIIGADPTQGFLVGGVSAGGNFANVLSHLARDEGLTPPLTGVMLSAHQCLPPSVVPEKYKERYLSRSNPRCMDAPILNRKSKKMFEEALQADESDPMFSAFNWPTGHGGLPTTYLQVCGMDINRDEALIYQSVLREEKVRTRIDVYPGMPHVFWSVFRDHSLTRKWWVDTLVGVAWLLAKEAKL